MLVLGWSSPAVSAESLHAKVQEAVTGASLEALRTLREEAPDDDPYLREYIDWRIGQLLQPDSRERKKHLKATDQALDRALKDAPDNAEMLALRGAVLGDRITGTFSGISLGPKSAALLDRAHELAPNNPRVVMLRGTSFFFKPKAFGGGIELAREAIEQAIELFAKEDAGTPWPNWGQADAHAWHGRILAAQDLKDEALTAYQQALAVNPGYAWVEQVLIPELVAGNEH